MGPLLGHVLQFFLLAAAITGAPATLSSPQQTEALDEWDAIARAPLARDVITFANGTELRIFPAAGEPGTAGRLLPRPVGQRRALGDFRQCSPCTCCDRTRRWCLPTVCCYNIRCGLQGLPYGLCSFIPVSCTCYGCRD